MSVAKLLLIITARPFGPLMSRVNNRALNNRKRSVTHDYLHDSLLYLPSSFFPLLSAVSLFLYYLGPIEEERKGQIYSFNIRRVFGLKRSFKRHRAQIQTRLILKDTMIIYEWAIQTFPLSAQHHSLHSLTQPIETLPGPLKTSKA
jgi:hypothetical protein